MIKIPEKKEPIKSCKAKPKATPTEANTPPKPDKLIFKIPQTIKPIPTQIRNLITLIIKSFAEASISGPLLTLKAFFKPIVTNLRINQVKTIKAIAIPIRAK